MSSWPNLFISFSNSRHVDYNQISNITEFSQDAFDGSSLVYYYSRLESHDPFDKLRSVIELWVVITRMMIQELSANVQDLNELNNWLLIMGNLLNQNILFSA